jgi:two-component system nitrate/nitrite response regulator NarL
MRSAKLLLIGQNTLRRVGLNSLLKESPFLVIGEVSSAASIDVQFLPEPDITLLECRGNLGDTRHELRRLGAIYPSTPVVVLSETVNLQALRSCLEAGASGFLTTDISRDVLLRSLQLAALGETVFPTELAGLLACGAPAAQLVGQQANDFGGLSNREIETIQCLLRGDSNKLIANRLHITEATIKIHIRSVMRKINVTNRTQAAIWAHSRGLLPAHDAAQILYGSGRIGRR